MKAAVPDCPISINIDSFLERNTERSISRGCMLEMFPELCENSKASTCMLHGGGRDQKNGIKN